MKWLIGLIVAAGAGVALFFVTRRAAAAPAPQLSSRDGPAPIKTADQPRPSVKAEGEPVKKVADVIKVTSPAPISRADVPPPPRIGSFTPLTPTPPPRPRPVTVTRPPAAPAPRPPTPAPAPPQPAALVPVKASEQVAIKVGSTPVKQVALPVKLVQLARVLPGIRPFGSRAFAR